MKLKEIKGLLPTKLSEREGYGNYNEGYSDGANCIIDDISEKEIELDIEKIYEKISLFQVFQGLGTATVYQDSLYKFIGKENCYKLAQTIAKENVIKLKEVK